jgi:hypothetical protein
MRNDEIRYQPNTNPWIYRASRLKLAVPLPKEKGKKVEPGK